MSNEEIRKAVSPNGIIRAAILATLEGGCTCEAGERHPWEFEPDTEPDDSEIVSNTEVAQMQRERFADAVIARIPKG